VSNNSLATFEQLHPEAGRELYMRGVYEKKYLISKNLQKLSCKKMEIR
jgi:hypothetical protein